MLLPRFFVSREIGADRRPRSSAVVGREEPVAAEVERLGIPRRRCERCRPLEPVFQRSRPPAALMSRPGVDVRALSRGTAEARGSALLAAAVDDVVVRPIENDPAALA